MIRTDILRLISVYLFFFFFFGNVFDMRERERVEFVIDFRWKSREIRDY